MDSIGLSLEAVVMLFHLQTGIVVAWQGVKSIRSLPQVLALLGGLPLAMGTIRVSQAA